MNAATLFLFTTLVLRSGQHIDLDGPWSEDAGRIIFRSASGTLYSVPKVEVDLETTRAVNAAPLVASTDRLKLKVSEDERKRLIQQLEQNHAGTPPAPARSLEQPPAPVENRVNEDEWTWRNRARGYEEQIRQMCENRDLLVARSQALRAHIAGLISLGYKTSQFTYDSTQLQLALEQIPYADLDIQRAQRAYDQFRDDARRQGIPPGWLR